MKRLEEVTKTLNETKPVSESGGKLKQTNKPPTSDKNILQKSLSQKGYQNYSPYILERPAKMLFLEAVKSDIGDRFAAIRQQEDHIYKCLDYFSPEFQAKQAKEFANNPNICQFISMTNTGSSLTSSARTRINECWRDKICEWSYQVIDHFDFNREIVSISLNYLDRYLSTCPVNRKVFQLAGMTSLFLAIKLYETSSLKMSTFIELSRGYFSIEHLTAMETAILRALSWHVHPPTPLSVVKHLMLLIPDDACHSTELNEIKELARFLTELSVCDYFFVQHTSMSTGVSALLVAIELINGSWKIGSMEDFLQQITSVAGCDYESVDVLECKARLRETYIHGEFYKQQEPSKNRPTGDISPACVSNVPVS